jgi:hypothetical protein
LGICNVTAVALMYVISVTWSLSAGDTGNTSALATKGPFVAPFTVIVAGVVGDPPPVSPILTPDNDV